MKKEEQLFKKFGQIFPAGTILFEEGQACTGMFIIQKGLVRLYKKAGSEEVTIDVLKDGDFFGEMACLIGQPRSINARVEMESQILLVQPEVLDSLFRGTSSIGIKVVGNLAARLRKSYAIIEKLIIEQRQQAAGKDMYPT
jgi:CRP-like cAMP-binding protein